MKTYKNPDKTSWDLLCKRPQLKSDDLTQLVQTVFTQVKKEGDKALIRFTEQFDRVKLTALKVTEDDLNSSVAFIPDNLKDAILTAKTNIEKFHKNQWQATEIIETSIGVKCWRENRAIEKVGIYIPGGSAPLFSTILMLGIPAKIAGCEEIVLCTPPNASGDIDPVIKYVAHLIGITQVFKVGGIQAIAAMTFGTELIPKVDKIFGPGNQYVTAAKQFALQYGVAIDLPAGPSEVLIIADQNANPVFVAADLLAQAEHGADSQSILLSNSLTLLEQVEEEIKKQIVSLSRKDILSKSLQNCRLIYFESLSTGFEFSNSYAPEHLILSIENFEKYLSIITNTGSVFLGAYTPESAGDYLSGTNHTLPTNGYARNYSGVSLDSFVKKITFQNISKEGLMNIGNKIEIMAATEQLTAHQMSVTYRLNYLKKNVNP